MVTFLPGQCLNEDVRSRKDLPNLKRRTHSGFLEMAWRKPGSLSKPSSNCTESGEPLEAHTSIPKLAASRFNGGADRGRPFAGWRRIGAKPREQCIRFVREAEHVRERPDREPFRDHFFDHRPQGVEVAFGVEK